MDELHRDVLHFTRNTLLGIRNCPSTFFLYPQLLTWLPQNCLWNSVLIILGCN